jgi:hypothetical protein
MAQPLRPSLALVAPPSPVLSTVVIGVFSLWLPHAGFEISTSRAVGPVPLRSGQTVDQSGNGYSDHGTVMMSFEVSIQSSPYLFYVLDARGSMRRCTTLPSPPLPPCATCGRLCDSAEISLWIAQPRPAEVITTAFNPSCELAGRRWTCSTVPQQMHADCPPKVCKAATRSQLWYVNLIGLSECNRATSVSHLASWRFFLAVLKANADRTREQPVLSATWTFRPDFAASIWPNLAHLASQHPCSSA